MSPPEYRDSPTNQDSPPCLPGGTCVTLTNILMFVNRTTVPGRRAGRRTDGPEGGKGWVGKGVTPTGCVGFPGPVPGGVVHPDSPTPVVRGFPVQKYRTGTSPSVTSDRSLTGLGHESQRTGDSHSPPPPGSRLSGTLGVPSFSTGFGVRRVPVGYGR